MNEDKISRTPDVTDERELIYCLPLYISISQKACMHSIQEACRDTLIPIKVVYTICDRSGYDGGTYQRLYPIESPQFVSTTIY